MADTLQSLLQIQLASDTQAILHAPHVLSCINPRVLASSPHLTKWLTRINSLLRSKDPGVLWAGLSFALQSALASKSLLIESGNGWISVALPIITRNDPTPTTKVAIRLLRTIFSKTTDVVEFQRQVATPNVPKFSEALLSIVRASQDLKLKAFALDTLAFIIPLYPSLHRQLQNGLMQTSLQFLDGSAPNPTNKDLLHAASQLYSVLHATGGKVAASNVWRKSVEDALRTAWPAFRALRTTFSTDDSSQSDPIIDIPLNLDRLKCCIVVLCDLSKSTVARPVQLPLGSLTSFVSALLSCTEEDQNEERIVDRTRRNLELSVLPSLWCLGCQLADSLALSFKIHLTSYLPRLLTYVLYHLESSHPSPVQKAAFLRTCCALLTNTHSTSSEVVLSRIARVVLPILSSLLPSAHKEAQASEEVAMVNGTSKKGKKRARGYEGEEILKNERDYACSTVEEGDTVIAALEVLPLLLANPALPPTIQSLSGRALLSLLLSLPQVSPSSLSPDPSFHTVVSQHVTAICTEFSRGTTSVLSKTLGILIGQLDRTAFKSQKVLHDLDLLIHPRLPPLLRSVPHVENLALFKAEESLEEAELRSSLLTGPQPIEEQLQTLGEDIVMNETTTIPATMPQQQTIRARPQPSPKVTPVLPPPASPVQTAGLTSPPVSQPALTASFSALQDTFASSSSSRMQEKDSLAGPSMELEEEDEEEGTIMPPINADSDSD